MLNAEVKDDPSTSSPCCSSWTGCTTTPRPARCCAGASRARPTPRPTTARSPSSPSTRSTRTTSTPARRRTSQKDLGFVERRCSPAPPSPGRSRSPTTRPQFVEYIDSVLSTRTPRDPFPPAPLDETELEQASLLRRRSRTPSTRTRCSSSSASATSASGTRTSPSSRARACRGTWTSSTAPTSASTRERLIRRRGRRPDADGRAPCPSLTTRSPAVADRDATATAGRTGPPADAAATARHRGARCRGGTRAARRRSTSWPSCRSCSS